MQAFLAACAGPAAFPGVDLVRESGQHVVVVVEHERDSSGTFYRFAQDQGAWRLIGDPVPASVGAGGIGKTREGDRRAPTGAYRLTTVFGYAPLPPGGLRMPYLPLRPETQCVDDADSPHYNQIVNPSELPAGKTWTSSELMRRDLHHGDDRYRLGVEVAYNPAGGRDPASGTGAGSCIFLHIWRGPDRPTVGCTAFSEGAMLELLQWLDPAKAPVLIQGSRADLDRLHRSRQLPYAVPR